MKEGKNRLLNVESAGAIRTRRRACPLTQHVLKQSFLFKYARFRRVKRACEVSGVRWCVVRAWLKWDATFRRHFMTAQRVARKELSILRAYWKAAHKLDHEEPFNRGVLSIRMRDGSSAMLQGRRLVIRLAHGKRQPFMATRAVAIVMARRGGATLEELAQRYGVSRARISQIVQKVGGKESSPGATG